MNAICLIGIVLSGILSAGEGPQGKQQAEDTRKVWENPSLAGVTKAMEQSIRQQARIKQQRDALIREKDALRMKIIRGDEQLNAMYQRIEQLKKELVTLEKSLDEKLKERKEYTAILDKIEESEQLIKREALQRREMLEKIRQKRIDGKLKKLAEKKGITLEEMRKRYQKSLQVKKQAEAEEKAK
ncbi:MAG: hypothetical protein D6820_11160 [Lentisphaerae bacterium]|nr:MAG: hypothetical protein D6820_11160 [Lentisphaerota bacterium]